jgi:pimeloyl-ACP methyl ester carboxylesterase
MLAGKNKNIAYVVLLAGSGIPGEEIIYEQTKMMFQDLDKNAIEKQVNLRHELISVIKTEANKELAGVNLEKILKNNLDVLSLQPIQDTAQLIKSTVMVFNSDWFRFFIHYNPANDLVKITCPVLALIGEKDFQVLPKQNLSAIKEALQKGGNKNFLVKEIPNANHLFQTSKTGKITEYSEIEETISPDVLSLIANWIIDLKK